MNRNLSWAIALSAVLVAPVASAQLVNNEWNAGNGNWNIQGNWFPFGVPDNGADGFDFNVLIGNRAVAANAIVTFVPRDGTSDTVSSLALSNGADFLTNGNRLIVLNQATVDGLNSTLRIDPNAAPGAISFQATNLVIRNNAKMTMNGGVIYSPTIDVASNATVQGGGLIIFGDADTIFEDAFDNSGVIIVGLGGTENNSLTLQTNGIDYIDLDGDNEHGTVDVSNNVADPLADTLTLIIDAPLEDGFSGTLQIGSRDTVNFKQRLLLTGATVQLDGGDHFASLINGPETGIVDVSTFTVNGDAFLGGPILIGNSNFTVSESSSLTLAGSIWIDKGLILLQNNSELVVTESATITNTGDFNWDGTVGNATTTIRGNGSLTIGVDEVDVSSNDFSGTLNLVDNGKAIVNVTSDTWTISGTLNKTAAGTSSIAGDALDLRGAVNVSNGTLALPKTILSPGAVVNVASDGVLELGDASRLTSPTSVAGAGMLRMAAGSTVAANTTIDVATFDWDGTSAGSLHTVGNSMTFTINSPTFDDDGDMDDRIILGGRGAQLIVNGPTEWTMNGIFSAGIGAGGNTGTSTIGGTSRMIVGNRLNVDGDVIITASVTFGDGSLIVTGTGTRLNVIGEASYGSATIGGGSGGNSGVFDPAALNDVFGIATIRDINFDFDGGDWNVRAGGQLKVVNVRDYDLFEPTNGFDRTITVTDGDVLVDTLDPRFVMNGTLALTSTIDGQTVDWEGDAVDIGDDMGVLDAKVIVTGTRRSRFMTDVTFHADVDVSVGAGATLAFENHVLFNAFGPSGSSQFRGEGTLLFQHTATFIDPVTFDMFGGTIDLDGDDATGNTITVTAPVTINAAVFSDFGRANAMGGVNIIDVNNDLGFGALTINLDSPTANWTLNQVGELNLVNGKDRNTLLSGSDVILNGDLNVSGDIQTNARLHVAGAVHVSTPGEPLQLNGGDQGLVPNRIAGGVVSGVGLLGANADRALYGFGTINTGVDFDGTAILRADDGVLTINGPILDVGQIGTEDQDSVLNVTNPWNSDVADLVRLKGGELRGGALTVGNAEGLVGFGLVSAKITNNTRVAARGGALILETSANDNDWDGAANAGMLIATSGDTLELRDNANFSFGGVVSVSGGGHVFTNGFAFSLAEGSALALDNGTFQSTHTTSLGGNMNVAGASAVTIADGELLFKQGSSTNIAGELTLPLTKTAVEAGATFAGVGSLKASAGSELSVNANAVVDVLVDNQGSFLPAGNEAIGRVTLGEFQQSATGSLTLELAGIGLNQFDRLTVAGGVLLGGRLNIDVDGGFIPTLGQTFNVLTAADGISGTFSSVQLTDMPAGLSFQLNYLPTIVQLKVVSGPSFTADFDRDGDVDGDDLAVWRPSYGVGAGGDADGDGDTDGNDFLNWQRQLGSRTGAGGVAPSAAAVPEPASFVLALTTVLFAFQCYRRCIAVA